jgi:CYTH domain-containing protein
MDLTLDLIIFIESTNIEIPDKLKSDIDNWLTNNGINREKEFRFVIKHLPNLELIGVKLIEQVYVGTERWRSEQTAGVRKGFHTIKYRTNWGNFEKEIEVDPTIVDLKMENPDNPRIKKIRHLMKSHDGFMWEVDLFDNFIIAECEWKEQIPDLDWIIELGGKDITGNKNWSNNNLACKKM